MAKKWVSKFPKIIKLMKNVEIAKTLVKSQTQKNDAKTYYKPPEIM